MFLFLATTPGHVFRLGRRKEISYDEANYMVLSLLLITQLYTRCYFISLSVNVYKILILLVNCIVPRVFVFILHFFFLFLFS